MGSSYKSKARKQHLTMQAQGFCNNLQTNGGIVNRNTMRNIQKICTTEFKLPHQRAIVCQPLAPYRLINSMVNVAGWCGVGSANVEFVWAQWSTTKQGQLINGGFQDQFQVKNTGCGKRGKNYRQERGEVHTIQ